MKIKPKMKRLWDLKVEKLRLQMKIKMIEKEINKLSDQSEEHF